MGLAYDENTLKDLRRIGMANDAAIAEVNRLIAASSPELPKNSFEIDTLSDNASLNKLLLRCAALGFVLDVILYAVMLMTGFGGGFYNTLSIALGAVFLLLMIIAAVTAKALKDQVRVMGEELRINEKSYFACNIEGVFCNGPEIKVKSGGNTILKLNKTQKGCDEFIKWARAYDIPIDNSYSVPSIWIRILIGAGLTAAFAAVAALMLRFALK